MACHGGNKYVPCTAVGNTGSAKVADSLASSLAASEEDGVGTSWTTKGKLVEGKSLTTGLDDASASTLGEVESSNGHLGHGQQSGVIGDSSNNNGNRSLLLVSKVDRELGGGDWWAVDTAHAETVEHNAVELGVGSTSQEAVELNRHTYQMRGKKQCIDNNSYSSRGQTSERERERERERGGGFCSGYDVCVLFDLIATEGGSVCAARC
jgi:hypothetical protein